MAVRTPTELKSFFQTGLYPTQSQFEDLIDSIVSTGNMIPYTLATGPVDLNAQNLTNVGIFASGSTVTGTRLISTIATGTAPLTVTSTTLVPNLYVARAVLADGVTTNANLTGPITSSGNATSIASQTGTGTTFAMQASPTFTTSITSPLIIGGTSTTSSLIYKTTTGAGTTNADHIFQVGNNGATEAMRILNNGRGGFGTASPSSKFHIANTDSALSGLHVFNTLSSNPTVPGLCALYGQLDVTANADQSSIIANQLGVIYRGTQSNTASQWGVIGNVTFSYNRATAGTLTALSGELIDMRNISTGLVTSMTALKIIEASNVDGMSGGWTANGTLTTFYGIDIHNQQFGATNNIGISSRIESSSPGAYNLYISGTAQNYIKGSVGIGTTAPSGIFEIVGDLGGGATYYKRYGAAPPSLAFGNALGTVDAPTANSINNILARITATGYNGSTFANAARIDFGASESFTATNNGGHMIFYTTPTGATQVLTERMRILSSGNVGIGQSSATAYLHIKAGTATASTAPLKLTTGTVTTTAEAGAIEYNNTFHVTNSDATRRHIATAPNATKVTAAAPYTNDGYIVINIGGTDFKVMTTA